MLLYKHITVTQSCLGAVIQIRQAGEAEPGLAHYFADHSPRNTGLIAISLGSVTHILAVPVRVFALMFISDVSL